VLGPSQFGVRTLVAALLASPLALTASPTLAAPPDAGASAVSDWTQIDHTHPADQQSFFMDTWSDGTDVWAAGYRRTIVAGTVEWRTWVQRCSASAGTCHLENTRDVESAPSNTFLEGVTGTSASDVWVAGYATPPFAPFAPLTEHWDGSTWTIVPTPVGVGSLYAISSAGPDDVWAVGLDRRVGTTAKPLALHWDGTAWSEDPVQVHQCEGDMTISDVDADGRHPIAVATCYASGQARAMILSRRAHGWRAEPITGVRKATLALQSVEWVGNKAWIGGAVRGSQAVTLRQQDGVWTSVPTPGKAGLVNGFAGSNANDVWAVGVFKKYGWMTMHWDGTEWTRVNDPGPGGLEAVTLTSDGTPWAVGANYTLSTIQRYDGPL
jgi:hypothetical protein